jgi:DNA repair protein RadC
MAFLRNEEFRVLILNNKNHVLKCSITSVGTVSEAIIHPREIFRDAIREAGASIIVAHNHPSGVVLPSKEDIASTRRIKEAGFIIGIELLDHVIISASSYFSLKEAGYI